MLVELKVPVLPESVTEGTLGEWHKKVGDSVAADENVVDLETDKVVLEIVATSAGIIDSIAFETGDTVKNEDVLGVINTDVPANAETEVSVSKETPTAQKASPAVRKLINENDLSIDDIKASGKKGQVLKEDVLQHLKDKSAAPVEQVIAASALPAVTPVAELSAAGRNDRRVPMSRLRAKIAERLKEAQNTAAM
jgi:2-oxoglutarate dehydrogenase E2 component (dihydrolipoamide succinyltransferase)